ncbi:MATE family efflux transporter [Celeribacter marinus]|uniref:Multidrug-efflux transporter n=1 Tax=Celeribacter marinus TaxID=1397108 RepID=A0A0N9ZRR2_9RHOB|nr:MATE family efflux transporter [Celeribacter marinus]ALI56490.1 Multidrug and toxin extrusion (MATE) family efflux pump YdhE/NorM [Celeribacter marinus]SFK41691.1 multidrug resistance protein, MATE family [Celeribacter marinus]
MQDQKTYSTHARAVIALALPLAGSQLAQFALHMTDVIMMGWFGLNELAALVLASGYWFITFILLAGFAFAVMPLVANAAGAGDTTVVRRSTRMAMWLSVLAAVAIYPLFGFSERVLIALGQEPEIAALAQPYLIVAGIEMLPALIAMVLRSYFSALERTRVVLLFTVIAVVANAGLNWVLIFGNLGFPAMGVIGSAVASLILSTLTVVALVIYAIKATPENELFRNLTKPDWDMFRTVAKMGVPIGLTSLAEVGLFNAAALMMGWISTVALAAHGVALQLSALAFMIQIGLSQAGTIRAGNAYGRRDEAGLRRGALVVTVLSLVTAALTLTVFLSASHILIGLFIAPTEPQRDLVLAAGAGFMVFAALFQFSDGGQVTALSLLRGVQDTTVPMWLASFSYWGVGLPVAYVCGFVLDMGGNGIWVGLLTGLSCAWVLMAWRFWMNKSRIGGVSA